MDRIGRIVVEPRGVTPQSVLEDQTVVRVGVDVAETPFVPSFPFSTSGDQMSTLIDFSADFAGFSIEGFNGSIQWFTTHHGPTGATLIGTGKVVLAPPSPFAEGFAQAMGRESFPFAGARDIFIRFPLEDWSKIEPQLKGRIMLDAHEVVDRGRQIYGMGFRHYFSQRARAEIPPPGSGMVVFVTRGIEDRGFMMRPLPDGKIESRLWAPRGPTIWEEVH